MLAGEHRDFANLMSEQSPGPRSRTLRSGKVEFNYGRSVVDCTVRNLSTHGACLELESLAGIPDTFNLVIAGDPAKHACRLMWRTEHRTGVAFDEPMPERRDARVPDRRDPPATEATRSDIVRAESARAARRPRRGRVRRRAARSGLARPVHQPRVPQDVASAGRESRRQSRSFATLMHHGCRLAPTRSRRASSTPTSPSASRM